MLDTELMFSSETDDWATPQDLFNKLDKVFKFTCDVCASIDNAKCLEYYDEGVNGLEQTWIGVCWLNPPYGRDIDKWIRKAYLSARENGTTTVCLIPARVDTRWWHGYCKTASVHFIKGRIKFGGGLNSAPFPSAIVVFRPEISDAMGR